MSATLCKSYRTCKGLFCFYHHLYLCQECGQKKHIFLLHGWGTDDMGSQGKAMFLIPIEFGWLDFTVGIPRQGMFLIAIEFAWLDFTVLNFIYIKCNAFLFANNVPMQVTRFSFKSHVTSVNNMYNRSKLIFVCHSCFQWSSL